MKRLAIVLCAVAVVELASAVAQADVLVDRGLPTININNTAGANRSNIGWAATTAIGTVSANNIMLGDDFTLPTAASQYHVTNIRVWMMDPYNLAPYTTSIAPAPNDGGTPLPFGSTYNSISLDLRQGTSGLFAVVGSPTITQVTYVNGEAHQGGSGNFRPMYQLDFAVDITASGGTLFDFALNVDGKKDETDAFGYGYYRAFLEGSNAALSGSPQNGSDGLYYDWNKTNGDLLATENSGGPDGGWDKSSDFNVQVTGDAVPEPATIIIWSLLGGLGIAVAHMRKRAA
jgi:hypothetical protein